MKTTRILFTTIFFYTSILAVSACDCILYTFCEWLSGASKVVEVEVLNKYQDSNNSYRYIDIKINELLFGFDNLPGDTLTIVDYQTSCDVFIHSLFNVGDLIVLSFDELETTGQSNFPALHLHYCRTGYLFINGESLIGDIVPPGPWMPIFLDTINYQVFKNDVANTCSTLLNPTPVDEQNDSHNELIQIVPNPTDGSTYVNCLIEGDFEYELFNASGQIIGKGKLSNKSRSEIELSKFPAGLYFIRIRNNEYFVCERIVKY